MNTPGNLERLMQLLATQMPGVVFGRRQGDDGTELVIRSPSDQVGELVVTDDGDELTVHIGTFTHSHWGCTDAAVPVEQRPDRIAQDVIAFIRAVLSDEIEFYGRGRRADPDVPENHVAGYPGACLARRRIAGPARSKGEGVMRDSADQRRHVLD